MARIYPAIFDAMLVIAAAAVLSLRGAGVLIRLYAWLSLLVLLAAAAAADAAHAIGTKLPHRAAAATAAVIPWALALLGFSLLLAMLRHARLRRAAAAKTAASAARAAEADRSAREPAAVAAPTVSLPAQSRRDRDGSGLDVVLSRGSGAGAPGGAARSVGAAPATAAAVAPAAAAAPALQAPPAAEPVPAVTEAEPTAVEPEAAHPETVQPGAVQPETVRPGDDVPPNDSGLDGEPGLDDPVSDEAYPVPRPGVLWVPRAREEPSPDVIRGSRPGRHHRP